MNLLEAVSRTLFYRTEDGRIVFRSWGAFGPCYLLTEQQRVARARIQAAYYCVMFVVVIFATTKAHNGFLFGVTACASVVGGNYILFWLFSRALPKASPPASPSSDHRRAQVRGYNQALGKPLLWGMLIC